MAQETDTPHQTLIEATQRNALDTASLTLIGTVIKPGGNAALVRTAKGDIRRLTSGDDIDGSRVMAVEPGVLRLARGDRVYCLELPGG